MIPVSLLEKKKAIVNFDTEPKTEAERALRDALQGRLREIIAQPLTSRTLVELEQTARHARALLIVSRRLENGFGAQMLGGGGFETGEIMGDTTNYLEALAPSAPAETFGSAAIREIVGALGKLGDKKETSVDLVAAVAVAREKGLTDLANKLEERLLKVAEEEAKLPIVPESDLPPVGEKKPESEPAVEQEVA